METVNLCNKSHNYYANYAAVSALNPLKARLSRKRAKDRPNLFSAMIQIDLCLRDADRKSLTKLVLNSID